ncbi:hypothetical protein V8F20_002893 [Naviculisporaceae sp. PSN 640]
MTSNDKAIDESKPPPQDQLPAISHKSLSIASTGTAITFLDVQLSDKSEAESSSDLECARRKRAGRKTKRPRGHRRKQLRTCTTSSLLMVLLAILALVVAAIGLWPSITSYNDSKKSIELAQWEAEKDFLEFCENHSWNTTACKPVKNVTLPSPPGSWSNNTWKARHAELKMPLLSAPDVDKQEEEWRRGR